MGRVDTPEGRTEFVAGYTAAVQARDVERVVSRLLDAHAVDADFPGEPSLVDAIVQFHEDAARRAAVGVRAAA